MYKLYWSRGTGVVAPQVMLEEIGADYEKVIIDIEKGDNQSPEFLAVNPLGQIPTMVLPDGTPMTESAAIILQLADAHPEAGLAPAPGSAERARFYRWIAFLASNVYMADLRHYYPERHTTDPGGVEGVAKAAVVDLDRSFAILNEALDPGPYLLGERFSAADLYLWMLVGWHPERERMLSENAGVAQLVQRVEQRPAVARVRAEHDAPG